MSTEWPTVRLDLESRPQALTIVRGMLSGVAELLAIDRELLDDLKTAVSEACNNVVLHAYGGEPGPMVVRLFLDEQRVRLAVEDKGVGLAPSVVDGGEGLGLSVIRALAEVTVRSTPSTGTRVEMEFAARRDGRPLLTLPAAAGPDRRWTPSSTDEILVSVSPVTLLPGVLGRLARTLAASAHFSLDRFSDVYLVTDTVGAHAAKAAAGHRIGARLTAADRRLKLTVGPFRPGASEDLRSPLRQPSPWPLAVLTDQVEIHPDGDGELLEVLVIDHRVSHS